MEKTRMILIGVGGAAALGLAGAAALALAPEAHGPMAMFDADKNQVLTLAEVRQGARTMFASIDADKDGRATHEELRAHHEAMGKGGHRGGHGGGGYGHKGGDGPDRGGPHRGGPMEMDKDGDGALTLAEVDAGLTAHFTAADANRDGSVTQEEMDAAHRAKHDAR
jgi:hypothetical protein